MPEGVFAKLSPSFPLEEGLALKSVCLLPPTRGESQCTWAYLRVGKDAYLILIQPSIL